MSLKETNRVKTIGVLPTQNAEPIPVGKIPDNGTQITEDAYRCTGTLNAYIVTAGKTLYCSLMVLTTRNNSGALSYYQLEVRNASDVQQYVLARESVPNATGVNIVIPFLPPLEVPAGYKIVIKTGDADHCIQLFVHGYEM